MSKVLIILNYSKKESKFPLNSKYDTYIINYNLNDLYLTERSTFRTGNKWENMLWFFNSYEIWKEYDYVWLPDSNIEISLKEIDTFLESVIEHKFLISQPSVIGEKNKFSHKVLLNVHKSKFRKSHFVENKMPCFKTSFINDNLLNILSENSTFLSSGWGIDRWWSVNFKNELYVVDLVKIKENGKENGKEENCKENGKEEMNHFNQKYNLNLKI
jgi:hypothetical protein